MIEKLKALEGVVGLRSFFALSQESGELIYSSEGLDVQNALDIARSLLKELSASAAKLFHLTFNFSDGRVFVYLIRDHLLVMQVAKNFDVVKLRSGLKVAMDRLREESKAAPLEKEKITDLQETPAAREHFSLLAKAMGMINEQAIEELGVFVATNAMKDERVRLLESHKALYAYSVRKDGSIGVRELSGCSIAEAADSAAEWMIQFFRHCHEIVPAFPQEMAIASLEPMREELEEIGFFIAWNSAIARLEDKKK